jgi:hypothetical protein
VVVPPTPIHPPSPIAPPQPIFVTDSTGTTALVLDDTADATARTVAVTATTVTGLPGPISFTPDPGFGVSSLTIEAGSGGNTIDVQSTSVPTAIHGQGNDTVVVSDNGSAQGIQADLSIDNAGGCTALAVDDSADATPRSVTLTSSTLTGLAPAAIAYGPGVCSLAVTGGSGGNTFAVQGTAALSGGTTLNAGAGGDTFNVGSAANTLDPIAGPLSIVGQGASTTLNIHDDGTTNSQDYSVYADSIRRFDVTTLAPNMAAIGYSGIGHLALYQGSAQAVINFGAIRNSLVVWSTAQGTTTDIYGGPGENFNEVRPYDADPGIPTDNRGIQGDVHVHGNNRFDSLGYYDYLHPAGQQTYTLSATATGGQIVDSGFATVTYDSKVVEAGLLTSRQGNNTVNVLSTAVSAADGTQIQANTGDHVIVGMPVSGGRTLAGIQGFLNIFSVDGNPKVVPAGILIDDSGNTTAHPAVVINGAGAYPAPDVVGLAPAIISWLSLPPATPVTIVGGSGGNTIKVTGTGPNPVALDGGGGINTLDYSAYVGNVLVDLPLGVATGLSGGIRHIQNVTGSQGNDLIVGDANANVLVGGTGRNVLIGGGGADRLDASKSTGDNLLIGGTTNWDTNLAALQAVMAEWDRPDLGFADRRSDLLTGTNGQGKKPLNVVTVNGKQQLILLTPATNPTSSNGTVHADTSPDTLVGGAGQNWFFYDGDDTLNPKKGDKTNQVR